MQTIHYFAYGSNMDPAQMAERCPSATFLCRASLPGWKVAFTRYSRNRRCGVADIIHEPGAAVWGVVYVIDRQEVEESLDPLEGYFPRQPREKCGYVRGGSTVYTEGNLDAPLDVESYTVAIKGGPYRPSKEYLAHMVTGAKGWRLPGEYVARLEGVETRKNKEGD